MHSRYRILQILADGCFHSGQTLGESLGLTRSAVWKSIKGLKEKGIDIYSVPGRGYRLASVLELLNRDSIIQAMGAAGIRMIRQMDIHFELDSTNRYLRQQMLLGIESGSVCLAEYQSQGQGRQGKKWCSPFGKNIYLSLFWRFDAGPMGLGGLSLAIGVAVVRALSQLEVKDVKLKWPNDIYWRNSKLGGILVDVSGESAGPTNVVIGVGLNLEMSEQEGAAIGQAWTDLSAIAGRQAFSRNQVCGLILHQLYMMIGDFSRYGLSPFLEEWRSHDMVEGKSVALHFPDRTLAGKALGIDEGGALLLECSDGIRSFVSGDVSLQVQM